MNFSESDSKQPTAPGLQMETATKLPRWLRPVWIVAALVVLVIGVLAVRLSAAPTVQWSQPSILEFLLPSTSKKLTVTFRSTENLSQVDVFVAPALAPVLSVSPTQLKKLSANKEYKLDLLLKAPSSSGVAFEGTVQLKMTQGTSTTQSSPLAIKLVIHNQPVPPDPGEVGRQTLEGIDSDTDGVRDDIQRWIILGYYASPPAQAALQQNAKAFQSFLESADDAEGSRRQSTPLLRALDCLYYVLPEEAHTLNSSLKAVVLNTELRSVAWVKANAHLSGEVFSLIPQEQQRLQCDFDPDVF